MIQPEELRINNWVNSKPVYTRPIDEPIRLDKNTLVSILLDTHIGVSYSPIPITEEWLLKFGFIGDHKEYEYFIEIEDVRNKEEKMKMEITTFGNWEKIEVYLYQERDVENVFFLKEIKHVHQLQNLYYSLTGKELEIKS